MGRGATHRDEAKEQFWREAIARQPGSGLSIRAYCRRHRLRETAFYFWRRELARRGVSAEAGPAFVPVRLSEDSAGRGPAVASRAAARIVLADPGVGGCIEIVLPGGQCVRVIGRVDRQALADVLAVLDGQPGPMAEGRPC